MFGLILVHKLVFVIGYSGFRWNTEKNLIENRSIGAAFLTEFSTDPKNLT